MPPIPVEPWSWVTMSGPKPDAVVRLAEAGIPGPADELINRPAVAIGRIEIAQRVERQPERIDLAVGEILGVRPVGPHPVGVARLACWIGLMVLALDLRIVVKAVAGIDPAVETPGKRVGHAVRVAVAEDPVEHLAVSARPSPSASRIR